MLAWLSPVHKHGVQLPRGLPGLEAFVVAITPPTRTDRPPVEWLHFFLRSSSALTNLVMLASFALAMHGSSDGRRVLGCAAGAAWIINSYWFLLDLPHGDLRIGYFLWWTSFGLLASVALRVSSQSPSRGRITFQPT